MSAGEKTERYRQRVQDARSFLAGLGLAPQVVCVLGSGLGGAAPVLERPQEAAYSDIPGFPVPTAPGHDGVLRWGRAAGREVAVLDGRFHFYEGYSTQEATLPLRVMALLGATVLLAASAAGGLDPGSMAPGDLMLVCDHINLIPDNPLRALTDDRWGERFVDMSQAYDPCLRAAAKEAAAAAGLPVPREGVYAAVPGPSLETPAETRMLRLLGADAVGMSTVPEVIVARQAGMRVLVLAVIVNTNDPEQMAPIRVDEVLAAAGRAAPGVQRLLAGVLPLLDRHGPEA